MDDRLRIGLWIVGGGAFAAVLGGAFGGLSGALLFARSDHTAGTGLARRIADAFGRTADREPSPLGRAVLIGAADGFLFLGILGLVAGALLGASGRTADELLLPMVVGSVVLAAGAILFGTLAYALTRHTAEFLSALAGGFLGSFLAASLLGSDYGPVGLVPGLYVGLFLCRAARRYSPTFQPPRVGRIVPRNRSDSETDITETPHAHPDVDSYRKPEGERPA